MARGPARFLLLGSAFGALLSLTTAVGCGSATPAPVDAPPPTPTASPADTASGPTDEPPPMGTVVKREGDAPATAPAQRQLTDHDCAELGRVYDVVQRNDLRAGLSPKLSDKQRAKVEENIDRVVRKIVERWVEGCATTLAGSYVDESALKCVNTARSVKQFDVCLNGEDAAAPKGGQKKPKAGSAP